MKHSKTDQERKGMKVIIGMVKDDLCPILPIPNFLKVKGSYSGPLFCRKTGTFLSKSRYVTRSEKSRLPHTQQQDTLFTIKR